MFFILSKALGFFSWSSNIFMTIGLVGLVLLCTRWTRLASWLIVSSLVLLAIAGYSPLANVLILPLEDRFPLWDAARGPPDGIVVLGGVISPEVSIARNSIAIDETAERITFAAELARRYPKARIIVSGGSAALIFDGAVEAPFGKRELEALGVPAERIAVEDQSRNTIENAELSRRVADPKPGERWLLVTSAYHMPRAMAAFRLAGFPVEACPVDWRTRGAIDLRRPFGLLSDGLHRTDTAFHEWLGLLAYRLTGKTTELLPAP
jgi:uncharacterized SAM-binding protein YcdF (DUF218 family)